MARSIIREVRRQLVQRIADDAPGRCDDAAEIANRLRQFYDLNHDPQESLFAVYFTARGKEIATERIFRGTINSALVSTRDIAVGALLQEAVGVVVAHNHPSGDPTPGAEDLAFTRKLCEALRLLDIDLIDHVIIGSHRHVSMREKGQV